VPEWYFLPFYAILRAFTDDVWIVIVELRDRRHHRREVLRRAGDVRGDRGAWRWRPGSTPAGSGRAATGRCSRSWFWLFVVDFFVLMWAGAMPAEGIYPYIALIGSAYWFAYFLVILPLLGVLGTRIVIETTR
jgi:ubiquinol-cytochrome c reductase cytochrome b subunit